MAENITAYLHLDKFKALNTQIYRHMYKTLYKKVDGIHYPTGFIKYHFEYEIGGKQTPGYIISNGADRAFKKRDVARPAEYEGKYIVASTGRYSREKRQEALIKAVLRSKYESEIQLVLAGHGARDKYYKRISKKLTNPPIFKVFSREDMAKLLNISDLYVHPAYIELEGIACLEAMKCGVPTIVSDSPLSATYDFAADEKCIFEDGNIDMLAERIDALIKDPAERARISKKTLAADIKYSDECMPLIDAMIANIIKKKAVE